MTGDTTPALEPRREFLKAAGAGIVTANLFPIRLKGANDRVTLGFIGMGSMGIRNLRCAMRIPGFQPVAVCDLYGPHLDRAQAQARKGGFKVKAVKDFREILADRSIDAVCISTPDHWHAYMTVEACKAGKDVYVEQPACAYLEEGLKMVEAARKYGRIVQAGAVHRSGAFFQKAKEIVQSGALGEIVLCQFWRVGLARKLRPRNPADSLPPSSLDRDLWLGPASHSPFNEEPGENSSKRRPAPLDPCGAMAIRSTHLLDVVHYAFDEVMPWRITALGDGSSAQDNTATLQTVLAIFRYPGFAATYDGSTSNSAPLFGRRYGVSFFGTESTLVVNHEGYCVLPTRNRPVPVVEVFDRDMRPMHEPHWRNWLDCIRSRQSPVAEIETSVRSTIPCLLADISMRFGLALHWDEQAKTVAEREAHPYLRARYREPWELQV